MTIRHLRPAQKIAGAYALFGIAWILVSDELLLATVPDKTVFFDLSLWKGLVFVLGTAFLIYLVADRHKPRTVEEYKALDVDPRMWPLVLVFALLAAVIVLAGIGSAAYIAAGYRNSETERLQAIADLKVRQIGAWLAERRADAHTLLNDDSLAEDAWRWREKGDAAARDRLLKRLNSYRRAYGYGRGMLLDETGGAILTAGAGEHVESPILRDTVRRAIAEHRILDTDLYRIAAQEPGEVHLEFVIPLPETPQRPRLAITLDADPANLLFPLVQSWPTPSASGETLLFRKDGERILYLNELRHLTDTALRMSVPVAGSDLLAVQVATGRAAADSAVEGVDYRGVPVVGVVKVIGETGWYLVAKLDKEELYAQARRDGAWILLVVSLALLAATAASRLAYKRRELRIALAQHRQEAEKAQALQHLRQAEEQLRMLWLAVEQSPESILITDLDARIEYANEAFTRVSGYSREEALGQNPHILLSGKTPAATHAALWEALTAGRTWQGEFVNQRKNGEAYVEWAVISPVRQADGRITHYLAVKSDITERKRLDAELDRHRHHLEELVEARTAALARANRELESFSYSVSHDLRAPLRAINGYAHLLLEDSRDRWTAEERDFLNRVVRAANRMGQLIDDILEFSRVSRAEMKMAQVDMHGLAQACLDEQAGDYPAARIVLGPLPPAFGDETALRQVFANLIGNALKYSSKQEAPRIEIGAQEQEGETAYYVRDNGAGFSMEYAQRLFGVFQRMHTDAEFPGTGIGLAIVKNIVERHGGRVWAESVKGEGATFRFTLVRNGSAAA